MGATFEFIQAEVERVTGKTVDADVLHATLDILAAWSILEKNYRTKDGKKYWHYKEEIPRRFNIKDLEVVYTSCKQRG